MYTELVEYIVKSLVDHPDQVEVSTLENPTSVVVEVKVTEEDIGRVIGKNGRVVNAIRTLLQVQGTRSNKKVILEVE
jgi:predicted RNA-binding protein YlqC (UPF0109 family)